MLYKHNSHEFKGQFAFAPLISKSGLKCLDKVRDQLRTEKDRTKIGWENLNAVIVFLCRHHLAVVDFILKKMYGHNL